MNSRHCTGSQSADREYPSVMYDVEERRIAGRIERRYPHWHIEWGVGSRSFHAYPRFAAPGGARADSPDARDLIDQMRYIEQQTWPSGTVIRRRAPEAQRRENDA